MNNCTVCDDGFRNANPNKIICDGICRQAFHAECVNFSKEALLNYREMPNLQWFCDSCIIQTRSPNVSFPALNKFNSTAVVRTSSPSYIQHSFPTANRNRKPNPSAKLIKSSVFLETRSPRINRDIEKVNDLNSLTPKKEIRPVKQFEDSPDENGSHPLTTSAINQSDVAQPISKHTIADCKDITETLGLEIPSATSSSFA